jgi:hypothetical protein
MNGQISWVGEPLEEFSRVHTDQEAIELLQRAQGDEYLDVHVWCFEPHEFGELVQGLGALELISVSIDRLTEGPMGEFYVTFSTGPGQVSVDASA